MKFKSKLTKMCVTSWLILISNYGIVSASAQTLSLDNDPNLALHFNFEQDFSNGEVLDVSGNGSHGWQFNPTNWITSSPHNGVFDSTAAQFTYVGFISNDAPHIYAFSQYIAVTNVSAFGLLTNGTISFWARFDTNSDLGMFLLDCGYNGVYASNPSAASNSWTIGRYNAPYLSFLAYPSDGSIRKLVSWPTDVVQAGGYVPNLATTSFHLYTVTFDCQNNVAVAYYDGLPYMTNVINLPWLRVYGCSSQRWLCISGMAHDGTPQWGDDKYPNSAYFVGRMDDVRIYSRALTADEVRSLTDCFVANVVSSLAAPQTLALQWPFISGAVYRLEYLPDFAATTWYPLFEASTNYFSESITQKSRFYRVRIMP